jgi:hypothetical protein
MCIFEFTVEQYFPVGILWNHKFCKMEVRFPKKIPLHDKNNNKLQQQIKCGTRFENSAFQDQVKHEKPLFTSKITNIWQISF